MKLSKLSIALLTAIASPAILAKTVISPIVVTANNTEQTTHSVTANITIITAEDIQNRQHKTLGDALQTVPGLFIRSSGGLGTTTSINMRGLDGKNILILKNGIILNEPMGLSGANLNHIFLSDVERIEIIKGPQSGTWGADAVAGVINIITTQAQKTAMASFEAGSFGYKKLATSIGAGNDKVNFIVDFSEISTDGFSAIKTYQGSTTAHESDTFNQTDIAFNMNITPAAGHKIQTFIKNTTATTNFDSTWPSANPDATDTGSFDSTLKSLSYHFHQDRLQTKVFINKTDIERKSGFSTFLSSVEQYGASAQYSYLADQFFSLSVSEKTLQDEKSNNGYTNTGFAASNTNQFFNKNLIFTQSLRKDRYNRFDDNLTGKIGAKGYLSEQIFMAANYGTGYRAPNLSESEHSTLKPESTEGFDASFGAYGFELTYFKTETKDQIKYISGWPITVYRNLAGITTAEGIEASYQFYIDAINSDFNINYTVQTVKDRNNQWLARQPETMANFAIDNYSINNIRLGMNAQYVGTNYDKANQGGAQIGEYFVVDLTANYSFSQHLSIYGRVENLFNKDYTNAVAGYQGTTITPSHTYNRGGTQLFIGVRGEL